MEPRLTVIQLLPHSDQLYLRVEANDHASHLAADAGVFGAAERHIRTGQAMAILFTGSRFDLRDETTHFSQMFDQILALIRAPCVVGRRRSLAGACRRFVEFSTRSYPEPPDSSASTKERSMGQ